MDNQDMKLKCLDCGNEFVWTAAEQEFYMDKGFSQPKRCKPCREIKKQKRAQDGGPLIPNRN